MKQNDILGVGCTVYEMVTGEIITSCNQNFLLFLKEIRGADQTQHPSGACWDFSFELINLLQFIFDDTNEIYRPTAIELFNAPFF